MVLLTPTKLARLHQWAAWATHDRMTSSMVSTSFLSRYLLSIVSTQLCHGLLCFAAQTTSGFIL